MFEVDSRMIGKQVKFINEDAHKNYPMLYPPAGTIGIIVDNSKKWMIKWDNDTNSFNDAWYCEEENLEFIEEIKDYTPEKYGIIEAIRIFYARAYWPYATLTFAFGGAVTIDWANVEERNKYMPGINAYTVIYDERAQKSNFENHIRIKR